MLLKGSKSTPYAGIPVLNSGLNLLQEEFCYSLMRVNLLRVNSFIMEYIVGLLPLGSKFTPLRSRSTLL